MLNAVGLANPGLDAVREHELSWLAREARRARVLVNVAGATIEDYAQVIAGLTDLPVITAFEINASCPNTSAGGLEFGATPEGLRELVHRCRAVSTRPMAVKLSPVLPDIAGMARVAEQEGADAITLGNTIPRMLDGRLGDGAGGARGAVVRAARGVVRRGAAGGGGAGAGARCHRPRRGGVPRSQGARHSGRRGGGGRGGAGSGGRPGPGPYAGRTGGARRCRAG